MERLSFLLSKYLANNATGPEVSEMLHLLRENGHGDTFLREAWEQSPVQSPPADKELLWASIQVATRGNSVIRTMYTGWRVAAVVLILAGAATFYFLFSGSENESKTVYSRPVVSADAAPGGNKAVLTLADGTTIQLDDAADGKLAQQGSTSILKSKSGSLIYRAANERGEKLYNTITTPTGGQYQIVLPDGSKVWLNAASSLSFPATFDGGERRVTLTGEAYFEITARARQPFFVSAGRMDVQVLGTDFNVNAYEDESSVRATLAEGSVKVSDNTGSVMLVPGQQAVSTVSAPIAKSAADPGQATAWKDGLFKFNDASIECIMRQLARWYNVDVEYDNNRVTRRFNTTIPRNVRLSGVLEALELTGAVRFKMEGKKIRVSP